MQKSFYMEIINEIDNRKKFGYKMINLRRVSVIGFILKSFVLFSVFTVLQGISIFDGINRIWMGIGGLSLILIFFFYQYSKDQFIILAITLLLHCVALYFTKGAFYNINIIFYFALWVLFYMFFVNSKNVILDILHYNKRFFDLVIKLWTGIVGISVLLPSSYVDGYFFSFAGHSFRLLPSALIVVALAMYLFLDTENKKYALYMILPLYAAFMGKSRTYLGVMLIFLIMYLYMIAKKKSTFYLTLIPVCITAMWMISVSSISNKIALTQYNATSYFDYWGTLTSGRTIFWVWDIKAFLKLPFWQQFVGNGFNFVYDVNGRYMDSIWAHNDIINLLMNFGYIGVFVYLWSFYKLVKAFWRTDIEIPILVKIMFLGAVFINSMMNMSYTYLCAMISYPIFLCAINKKYSKTEVMTEIDNNEDSIK